MLQHHATETTTVYIHLRMLKNYNDSGTVTVMKNYNESQMLQHHARPALKSPALLLWQYTVIVIVIEIVIVTVIHSIIVCFARCWSSVLFNTTECAVQLI